jgi:hypothetical protein
LFLLSHLDLGIPADASEPAEFALS